MKTIAVIGDPVLDHIYKTVDPLMPGGKMSGSYLGAFPGGTTANFACAAAVFGLLPTTYGQISDNWEGELHRASLESFRVRTDGLNHRDAASGAQTVVAIGPGGEKTVIYVPFPDSAALDPAILTRHDLVYVMATDFDRIASWCDGETAEICVDVDAAAGLSRDQFAAVAKASDVIFMNDVGYRKLMGAPPDLAAIEALLAKGPALVCCTGGAGMTYLAERDRSGAVHSLQVAALPAEVVDTTGAGDCFNAAFLARRAQGAPLQDALNFAMAAGALATEKTGARDAIPTREAVLRLMES